MIKMSWKKFENMTKGLNEKITFKPDVIIAISRGGLLLGRLLSEYMEVPLAVIGAESYKGMQRNRLKISKQIATTNPIKKNAKILLVDDLVDSGKTMQGVVRFLTLKFSEANIKTAVLIKKPTSCFTPDYYVEDTNKWVKFPYEMV